MRIPDAFSYSAPMSQDDLSNSTDIRTGVTAVPFDIVEVVEQNTELFTVPDDEYYRVTAMSYLGRTAGTAAVYCRPPGIGSTGATTIYSQAFAAGDDLLVDVVIGHVFGPGEKLNFHTTGSGATANVKVSAERITGFLP